MSTHALPIARWATLIPMIILGLGTWANGEETKTFTPPPIDVPPGFVVEVVAAPPLVEHPMMAGFDEQGRLYVADSVGENLPADELLTKLPNCVRRLEDTDGDGRFDRSTKFADKMTLPMGALWHAGALYVASPPHIWRLEDTDDDGVADRREVLVSKFGFSGNAASIHGCFLGPCGRIYWCDGRHGHEFVDADGNQRSKGLAARVFSCRADGSDVEVFCGGGMDNPVEVCFLPSGEMLGTMTFYNPDDVRHDALVHFIWGGVYPRKHACLSEFKRTGPLMPYLSRFDTVAPAGLAYHDGNGLGPSFRDNVFSVQFNTHLVLRHRITRAGATFRSQDEPFLVSSSPDFHPTDVLVDADGSLLVIDTGGWFRIGCPTSRVAKPEILGAIYRVRRADGTKPRDARGLQLAWDRATADALAARLDDTRSAVRQRAIDTLARRGAAACEALAAVLAGGSPVARRNAVWALARMNDPAAEPLLVDAMRDDDLDVRLAALRAVGTLRLASAASAATALLGDGQPAVRREAATALGRIGRKSAVPALLDALALGGDRFVEHALIYALIELDDAAQTAAGLKHASPLVRRGALIALDQMDHGRLSRDQVVAQLAIDDAPLRKTALEIMARHPDWASEIVAQLRDWLRQPIGDETQRQVVQGALIAFLSQPEIERLTAELLDDPKVSEATHLLLLTAVGRSGAEVKTEELTAALGRALENDSPAVRAEAVATIEAVGLVSKYHSRLIEIGSDAREPAALRVAALAAAADGRTLPPEAFDFLVRTLQDAQAAALQRMAAAEALGKARLDRSQRQRLTGLIASAGPLELPALFEAFAQGGDARLGEQLVGALNASAAVTSIPASKLREYLERFPESTQQAAQPLWQRIEAARRDQQAHLTELMAQLHEGDAARGREIFFGQKTACSACHQVRGEGGNIGPDLSTIGRIRTRRDLLESIVYPSLSLARGYESVSVATADGKIYTGVIRHETAEAIYLRTAQRAEVRIARADIDELEPSSQSIMPQGLEKVMTVEELSHLLAFLTSLR